jgi:hypothetical protein
MIVILKHGDAEKTDPLFEGECKECGCEVRCNKSDTQIKRDDREFDITYVICPTCGNDMNVGKRK